MKFKMKKLISTVVIICAVAVSQAASVDWTCTLVKNGKGDDSVNNSGIAYLMLASDVADFTTLAGKGAAAINNALADALISYTPGTAGNYKHDAVANATLGLADATAYGNVYLVIFDTTTVTATSKFYVTGMQDLTTMSGDFTSSLAFGSQASASKLAANWSTVTTPEPTSGLLLLLGMAGLALKRKRA